MPIDVSPTSGVSIELGIGLLNPGVGSSENAGLEISTPQKISSKDGIHVLFMIGSLNYLAFELTTIKTELQFN